MYFVFKFQVRMDLGFSFPFFFSFSLHDAGQEILCFVVQIQVFNLTTFLISPATLRVKMDTFGYKRVPLDPICTLVACVFFACFRLLSFEIELLIRSSFRLNRKTLGLFPAPLLTIIIRSRDHVIFNPIALFSILK